MDKGHDFERLLQFLRRLPAMGWAENPGAIGYGNAEDGTWWVKFKLDIDHPLAWRHVQELGYVLNYLSLNEPLPTVFKPVSPPPYMNGGVEFLSWVVESRDPSFTPGDCAGWLEARLPRPVEDLSQWAMDDEESAPA